MPKVETWELENMFAAADKNHDGKLFNGEILLFLKSNGFPTVKPEDIKKYMADFDKTDDGFFEFEEFKEFIFKLYPDCTPE